MLKTINKKSLIFIIIDNISQNFYIISIRRFFNPKLKPVLGNVTGGLSGPAIRPVAVHMVYRTAQKVKIPIIAMGGIMTANDALEYIIAGATMVAVGTANFVDPQASLNVLEGIKAYMRKHKIENIKKLRGSLNHG